MRKPASVTRRTTLAAISATAAVAALPTLARAATGGAEVFRHGVASGDPDATSVVLWTRVTVSAPLEVEWEVASDPRFARIVRQGRASAGPERDFTVKVLAEGLEPGGRYFYRFRAAGVTSRVGQTRTLPVGRVEQLGIALASCSNFAFGYFNAYDAIARDGAVDFVLHTGDYIYEYGADGWGGDIARQIGRVHEPANEIVSLFDYRTRHAQYKTDAGSQAMLAAKPLLACWDDHESANNPWTGGAQNHQPDKEGDWVDRRAASIQAYFEWMPVREPGPGRTRMQFWRTWVFGDLATLATLETRHTARARQIDYDPYRKTITSYAAAREMERDTFGAVGRAMLARELEADLTAAWTQSKLGNLPWRLIGNPMPIARTRVPDVVGLGLIPDPASQSKPLSAAVDMAWKGKWNLPFYPDTWDGYDWARERLYSQAREAGVDDLVFLTGDSHSFWANRLANAAGQPMGVELGTSGVTSPGDFIESGFDPATAARLDAAFAEHNPEVVWTDNLHQGYVRVVLTRNEGRASFIAMSNIRSQRYTARPVSEWRMVRGDAGLDLIRM
ncbi:alkaline phosphatase D family protein [Novosphingobium ginsenosidimutans]|uniref:Alkaline phosphatase n=1 Tax=Novosphingobium ginsenosidimutans TaxID=1176536 RepID=A0A5B8S1K0_9SPHN|nr:alkaline phosphatase D family protein [Novosphingobium ginsenosidimutans]QEA15203.1 alkaline phosphatase [Novosphingobium ginsenosidimutans]